jgi:membrane protein
VEGHVAQDVKSVVTNLPARLREHRLTLVAAGVAFYAFLAFVPTMIAVVSLYGLVADESDVQRQVENVAGALPEEVRNFVEFQLTSIINANRAGVSLTFVVAIAVALWSASGGLAALVSGLHVVHGEEEPKGFVAKRGKALLLTLGAVFVLGTVIWLLAFLPALVDKWLGNTGRLVFGIVRWPVLAVVMVVALGLLYRLAVPASSRRTRLISPGSIAGTALWLLVSLLFAFYTANFANYSRTYGTLATIVVVLLWLYLSALAVLLGAEVDAIRRSA